MSHIWANLCPENIWNNYIKSIKRNTNTKQIILIYFINYNINPWVVYCEGPPSFIWGRGEEEGKEGVSQKMKHCYSSLQLAYTFKTPTKHYLESTVDIHFQNAHKTQKNGEG